MFSCEIQCCCADIEVVFEFLPSGVYVRSIFRVIVAIAYEIRHTDVPNIEFSQHIQCSLCSLPKNFKKVRGQIWRRELCVVQKTLGLLYSVAPSTLLAIVRCQPLRTFCPCQRSLTCYTENKT